MSFNIPTVMGCGFEVGPWKNCKLAAVPNAMGGEMVVIAVGAIGADEYDIEAFLWGPGDLSGAIAAAGGIGNFIVNTIWPAANAIVPQILSKHPVFAKVDNASPPTLENLNMALWEYTKVDPTPDGNSVKFAFKPYP